MELVEAALFHLGQGQNNEFNPVVFCCSINGIENVLQESFPWQWNPGKAVKYTRYGADSGRFFNQVSSWCYDESTVVRDFGFRLDKEAQDDKEDREYGQVGDDQAAGGHEFPEPVKKTTEKDKKFFHITLRGIGYFCFFCFVSGLILNAY
jgi:hypothetical protein